MGYNPWCGQISKYFYLSRWTLITPFERSLSRLSENQNIFDIGSTVLKLGQITEYTISAQYHGLYSPRSKAEKWQIRAPTNLWIKISFERSLSRLSETQKIFDIGSTVLKLGQITEYANCGPIPWIIAHGPRPKNDKLWLLPTYGLKYIIWKVSF